MILRLCVCLSVNGLDFDRGVSTCGDNLFKENISTGHHSFLYFIKCFFLFFSFLFLQNRHKHITLLITLGRFELSEIVFNMQINKPFHLWLHYSFSERIRLHTEVCLFRGGTRAMLKNCETKKIRKPSVIFIIVKTDSIHVHRWLLKVNMPTCLCISLNYTTFPLCFVKMRMSHYLLLWDIPLYNNQGKSK